jgi:hypothetical protein
MSPRTHPVWAPTFAVCYHWAKGDEPRRILLAEEAANRAVAGLLAHDAAARAAKAASETSPTAAATETDKGLATVQDVLTMLWLYNDHKVSYRSNTGLLLDIVERFAPEMAERLRNDEDPGDLLDKDADHEGDAP